MQIDTENFCYKQTCCKAHLGDDGHGGAQLLEAHLGNVDAVDDDAAAAELLQPEQAVDQRALARSRPPHHSAPRPRRYLLRSRASPMRSLHRVTLEAIVNLLSI